MVLPAPYDPDPSGTFTFALNLIVCNYSYAVVNEIYAEQNR